MERVSKEKSRCLDFSAFRIFLHRNSRSVKSGMMSELHETVSSVKVSFRDAKSVCTSLTLIHTTCFFCLFCLFVYGFFGCCFFCFVFYFPVLFLDLKESRTIH